MGLNIEHALKYMFKDIEWKKKFLIGSIFMIGMLMINVINKTVNFLEDVKPEQIQPYMKMLPYLIIIGCIVFIVSLILNIFSTGYFAKNTNMRIFKPDSNLLEWNNWKSMFYAGFKANMAIFVYTFLICIILAVPIAFIAAFAITLNKLMIILVILLSLFLILAVSIVCMFYIAAAALAYNTDLKFSSYFNFGLIKKLITKNFLSFFIYVILVSSLGILANIISCILMITIIGIIFIPTIYLYQYLVQNELAAQFTREALDLPIKE